MRDSPAFLAGLPDAAAALLGGLLQLPLDTLIEGASIRAIVSVPAVVAGAHAQQATDRYCSYPLLLLAIAAAQVVLLAASVSEALALTRGAVDRSAGREGERSGGLFYAARRVESEICKDQGTSAGR